MEKLPRLILGCQPFLGESYQGEDRNRVYRRRFSDPSETYRILKAAGLEYGVQAVASSPPSSSDLALLLSKVLSRLRSEGLAFKLAPCVSIPLQLDGKPVDDFRRWATYLVLESRGWAEAFNLKNVYLSDPILSCRPRWHDLFSKALYQIQPYGRGEFDRLSVDLDVLEGRALEFDPDLCLFLELGSETDFLALTGRLDLLDECVRAVRRLGFEKVFLGSHHAGSVIPILEGSGLRFEGYVTPLNPLGALMLPSKPQVEEAVRRTVKPVVAIKPLAGGRVNPAEAFTYVFREVKASSCMIGVASLEELEADLKAFREALSSG